MISHNSYHMFFPWVRVFSLEQRKTGLDCIDASQQVGEAQTTWDETALLRFIRRRTLLEVFQAMARCDFLLIPVLSTSNGRLGNRGVNQGYFMVNSW